MDINYVIFLAAAVVLAGLVLIVAWFITKKLLGEVQGYKYEEEIEAALRPFVVAAIQAAYKTAESVIEQAETTMSGADKKRIADYLYSLLPPTIMVNGKEVDITFVKRVVSKERWQQMVQDAFDRGIAWTDAFQHKLVEEALELIEEVNG